MAPTGARTASAATKLRGPAQAHRLLPLDRMKDVATDELRWIAAWVVAFAAAEVLGLGLAGGVLVEGLHAGLDGVLGVFLGATAGALEGGVVGAVLAQVLRTLDPALRRDWFVLGSIGGAVLIGCMAMAVPLLAAHPAGHAAPPARPAIVQLMFSICLGASAGMIFSAFQAPALERLGVRPRAWLVGNGAGWAAAMVLAFAGDVRHFTSAAAFGRGAPVVAGMGALVGLATALTLRHETRRLRGTARAEATGHGVSSPDAPDVPGASRPAV